MGQNLAAVNSFPPECIVRHAIILVPAYFGSHKGIDSGLLQNLGKCPGITEYVWQPEIFHVLSKLILDKLTSHKNLPGKGLPARKIAVSLHPHAAVSLPAAFLYPFSDILVNIRKFFFHILV